MKFRNVTSREYKFMVRNVVCDIDAIWADIRKVAPSAGMTARNTPEEKSEVRRVAFLDTAERDFRANNLVLRRRVGLRPDAGQIQVTLKCRSPDRYVAMGTRTSADRDLKQNLKSKFEEDIIPTFRSRFSASRTLTLEGSEHASAPATLERAARYFPSLNELSRDGTPLPAAEPLVVVHCGVVECVTALEGLALGEQRIDVAVIRWYEDESLDRSLVCEFSFRYKASAKQRVWKCKDVCGETYPLELTRGAFQLYQDLQATRWCDPEGQTKTRFIYDGEATRPAITE